MHHLADSMTKLCQGGEHDNAGGESIPMYYSSREEAELIVIGRSLNLSISNLSRTVFLLKVAFVGGKLLV